MASINYHTREISCKIVYYGPGLSGKTTNLQIIHRKVPKENKSEMVSLATETDRTLFFDFLPLDLGSIKGFATKFQLYTVPGQVYYNATRKLVLRGVDGVVFVADSQRDKMPENLESLKNLEENLREYGIELRTTPFVLQYNKRDLPGIFSVEEMNAQINSYGVPAYEAQAHQGVGVFTTLKAIGKVVIDTFNTKYSSRQTSRRPEPASVAPPAPMPTIPPPPAPVGLHMPPPAPIAAPESHGSRSGFVPPMPPRPVGPPPAPQPLRPPSSPSVLPPPPLAPTPAWPAAAAPAAPAGSFAPPPPIAPQPIQPRPMTPPQMPVPVPPPANTGIQSALVGGYGMDLPPAAPPPAQSLPILSTTGFAPPPPPTADVNPIPGLQSSYFQPPQPLQPQQQAPAAPVPAAPAPNPPTFRKGRLDGTMDAKELEEEIARMERELHSSPPPAPMNPPAAAPSVMPPPVAAPAPAMRPSEPFQFNPPASADPAFSDAFLSPEEIRQFQQNSHDYPTQRLPMNPGNGQA